MDFFSNKDKEDFCISDDVTDAFNFKYVSSRQFKHIIEDVRRDRMRKREKKVWSSYTPEEYSERSECEEDDSEDGEMSKSKRMMLESMEEVDQELERLKEDALPERKKRVSKNLSEVERQKGEAQLSKPTSRKDESSSQGVSKSKENTARITDMLLTIAEERSGSTACERSPVSKLECSARTRISRSERTLRPKSESFGEFRRSISDVECNYSSDESGSYRSYEDDRWRVRVHPAAAHKILTIQTKISVLLDEIAFRLGRIPLPDGDRDLRRRQQRVMEFAVRFSRNYLYDLGRQIGDVQRHLRAISPNARSKPTRRGVSLHVQAIEQKLTSAHQLLLNALDAYCKHIPSSVIKGQPGKLKEVLRVVVELNDICSKINLTEDYYGCGDVETPPLGTNTRDRCSAILSKLLLSSDNESQLVSHTTQSTPIRGQRSKKESHGAENSKVLVNRLSMYSAEPRLSRILGNKKTASTCTRERRRLANARKTTPTQHPSTPQQPNPSPATCKSSKAIGKREKTKIRLPQKEDEISTMMSTLPTYSDTGSSVTVSGYSQPSVLMHRSRTVEKSVYSSMTTSSKNSKLVNTPTNDEPFINGMTEGSNRITDEELSSLVPVIADLMTLVKSQNDVAIRPVPADSMEALMELLTKYRSSTKPEVAAADAQTVDTGKSRIATIEQNSRGLANKSSEKRSRPKNVQLICVPFEESHRGTRDFFDFNPRRCCGMTDRTRDLPKKSGVTADNSRRRNFGVAESSVEILMKYRDEYQRSFRSNPLYTSKSQNKPWDLVAWISDKLVDELVVDVSKEFQIDGVIRNLYELELKGF